MYSQGTNGEIFIPRGSGWGRQTGLAGSYGSRTGRWLSTLPSLRAGTATCQGQGSRGGGLEGHSKMLEGFVAEAWSHLLNPQTKRECNRTQEIMKEPSSLYTWITVSAGSNLFSAATTSKPDFRSYHAEYRNLLPDAAF